MEDFATYPVFAKMLNDPQLRYAVRPLLLRYTGEQGLKRYDRTVRDIENCGQHPLRARQAAVAMVTYDRDQEVFSGFAGFDWKKFGRGVTAVATGGASVAVKNRKKIGKKLKSAAKKSWSAFEKSVRESLSSLKGIKDLGDVMNLVKMAATGGLSVAADAAVAAVNEIIYELISPFLSRIGSAIGKAYSNGRAAVVRAAEKIPDSETGKKIAREVARQVWDLLLGEPICVFEEGCIGPVAKSLEKAGNPYVKLVGTILGIVYPILQGKYTGYDTSAAVYGYAGSKRSAGVSLIPKPKLPENLERTVGKILDAIDSDYAMGVPKSFERYKIWLVDMVARGYKGPRTFGGKHDAGYYFDHPDEALAVLKKADKMTGWMATIDKYLGYIERAWTYGKKSYDIYQALKDSDFTFDVREWKAGSLSEYFEMDADAAKQWASNKLDLFKREGPGLAKRFGSSTVKSKIAQFQTTKDKAASTKAALKTFVPYKSNLSSLMSKGGADVREGSSDKLNSALSKTIKGQTAMRSVLSRGLSGTELGVSTAAATMLEWQSAEIGLAARARYNEMAQLWLETEPKTRELWKKNTSAWRTTGVDYPKWYKRLNTDKMAKLEVAQEAFKLDFEDLGTSILDAVRKRKPSEMLLKKVASDRGKRFAVPNFGLQLKAAMEVEAASPGSDTQVKLKEGRLTPPNLLAAEARAGLDKKSWTPTLLAVGAATAAIAVVVATKR